MTTLKERLQHDMKSAMRAKEKTRLTTIRMALAAIKQREVDERTVLDDAQILTVVEKMIKQRREALEQYRNAGRDELAEGEEAEIDVLQAYMPEPLGDDELNTLIAEAIAAANASTPKDMGKVMAIVKPRVQGRADMGKVSQRIKNQLTGA